MANAPKLTKQHFEFIAECLKASKPTARMSSTELGAWYRVVNEFTARLKMTNDLFDAWAFKKACGCIDTE